MKEIYTGNKEAAAQENLWTTSFIFTILVNFLAYLGNFMLLSTLPLHVLNIGGNKVMAGLVSGIYYLTGFISRPKIGELLDQKGRKSIMISSLTLLLLTTISYNVVAYSVILLLIMRAIHGISWSATTTSVSTIASDLIPATRRNQGMGFFGISMSSAMALGPALGLYVLEYYNYTLLFLLSALCIAAALLTGFLKSNYYLNQISARPPIIGKSLEYRVKQNTKATLFEKTAIWPSFLYFVVMMTYATVGIFLPAYASEKSVKNIGIFYVVSALSTIIVRLISGRIADRYGTSKVLLPGMLFLAIGLQLLPVATSLSMFLVAAVIYGVGHGAVQPTINALVISFAPIERRGAANATLLCAMDLGIMVGSVVWGNVAQEFGFIYIYSTSTILIILSVAIYLVIPGRKL